MAAAEGGGGSGVIPDDGECGDDEIGGGDEDCEACGEGEVPNEDGTACESCPHGESDTPGVCATAPCTNDQLDSAAWWSLTSIPRDPWEELEAYACDGNGAVEYPTGLGSSRNASDVCKIRVMNAPAASSAYGHSHPYFTWDRDKGLVCRDKRFLTEEQMDDWNEEDGAKFGSDDKSTAKTLEKPMYLVVPERDVVKVYRKVGVGIWGGDLWDEEIVQP